MYSDIMVPVSLAHIDQLDRALKVAADLAKLYGATVHYVGVTATAPSEVAHTPNEFAAKFQSFVEEQAATHNIKVQSHPLIAHDPTADLNLVLEHAENTINADLVVVASHLPGFSDYLFGSHGSYLAAHSKISVFVIR